MRRALFVTKSARLSVIVAIAALLVACGTALADSSTSRHDLLRRQLARTVPSRIPSCATALVAVLPDECAQLELDLIVYRWRLNKDKLPPDITNMDIIVSALQTALKDPGLNKRFADLGAVTVAADRQTPEALGRHLKAEIDKWAPIIKAAGVYAD